MRKLYLLGLLWAFPVDSHTPKVTVIIVIDQFSAHYIEKLRPHLTGGIKLLINHGVTYLNAFFDHCLPGTGPGHTLLSTGTYGSVHGIINNKWYDSSGKKIECDDCSASHAAVFAPDGSCYSYGKSAKNTLVDSLSDQLVMHSYPHARNSVWSLSLKSRAAIAMAGRLGKAVWFDDQSGNFTSSKAYFKELPSWIRTFNKKSRISNLKQVTWQPRFPLNSNAYKFRDSNNYTYSAYPHPLINTTHAIDPKKGFEEIFNKTPRANQALIELAGECFNTFYKGKRGERFILWLSLSSLDKVAHVYGPNSREAIDMIYHMDHQLHTFINLIYERVPERDVLFVLTADHGIQPIPQLLNKEGFDLAKHIDVKAFIHTINTHLSKKYCIKGDLIQHFKPPQFYLNHSLYNSLPSATQHKITQEIKEKLHSLKGIRRVWTFKELQNASFADYDLDKYLQRQLYQGRSGDIFYSTNPYTLLTPYPSGASHVTQYAYDTQVPLIFYQPGRFSHKKIAENVFMPQVSVTLATILKVPRPSAAASSVLPGLKF